MTPIDGVAVEFEPASYASWRLKIVNSTDKRVKVLWDESGFVFSYKKSAGRLVSGKTRKMDVGKPQLAELIPAGSSFSEFVLVESLIKFEEIESMWKKDHVRDDRALDDPSELMGLREKVRKSIVGGRLSLVLEIDGQEATWTGDVIDESEDGKGSE